MKIGISLSGGGARGIAHLGILQALGEIGVKIDKIVGVSSGSIVGAFFASGYTPKEILDFIKKSKFLWSMRPTFWKPGLLDMKGLEKLFLKYLPDDNFEKLNIPLIISTTNLNTGEETQFSEGNLIQPILASCAMPFIFSPIEYQNKTFIDGGISNNMPTKPLEDCDIIIGSYSNPYNPEDSLKSSKSVLERSILLLVKKSVQAELDNCDILLSPLALSKFSALQFKKADEFYKIGYEDTIQKAKEIENTLSQKTLTN